MTTREELLEKASAELATALDARTVAIREAEKRVKDAAAALERAKNLKSSVWPKKYSVFVHNGKWDESVVEWATEECGFAEDSREMRSLAYIAYEVELVFEVYEDGAYKFVGAWMANDSRGPREVQGFGERNHSW